ncbi:MAG: hypothetical protein ABIG44_09160 [Planctomycetota bacterium]
MKALVRVSLGILCLVVTVQADAPLIFCVGSGCGGDGSRVYAYEVDSVSYPMVEFTVGTNDLNPVHYTNVLIPPGWQFAVENVGMSHACGFCTPHGEISPGPCYSLTAGRVRWWTDNETQAVEMFTFGFDHGWGAEDVGWVLLTRREGPPPQYYTFFEFWDNPVGGGGGPVHGPYAPYPLNLGPEELVGTDAGVVIDVPGYSVPRYVPWDGDELPDLVVGEGGFDVDDMLMYDGKVRIYLNIGQPHDPQFADYSYAQTYLGDLVVPPDGCQGASPLVVYWDADDMKDLLVGLADGRVMLFTNLTNDDDPLFDLGAYLQVGEPGFKVDISVGLRAIPEVVDWNRDGRKDLIVGALDGLIHVFVNEGTNTEPDFRVETFAQMHYGGLLEVPTARSSPVMRDIDEDDRLDLVTGNTEGQLLYYRNVGTDDSPVFLDPVLIRSAGIPIDLPPDPPEDGPRSRPWLCYWTNDGLLDALIGSQDGKVHLYQGTPAVGDLNCDGDINSYDIDPFICALSSQCPYEELYPWCFRRLADCNGDGDVNAYDIDWFILLVGSGG